jgi:hypothetical protein
MVCCPKDCCDVVLKDAPEYIRVTLVKTTVTSARACNQPVSSLWNDGELVFESSRSETISTVLKKVLLLGYWQYICPEIGDPKRELVMSITGNTSNYLKCFSPFTGEIWYGVTFETFTNGFSLTDGCGLFFFSLTQAPSGCTVGFKLLGLVPDANLSTSYVCGECGASETGSGEIPTPGGITVGAESGRTFTSAADFLGPLNTYTFPSNCNCPQDCNGSCVQTNYPGIRTCMAFGSIEAAVCVSVTVSGMIEAA